MLFDTVLAFDHVQHRILIIANARITADDDLESLYQFACAKIQFLERELERNLSHRAAPSGRRRSTCARTTRASGSRSRCARPRSTSPPATSIRSCCRSGSRPRSSADPFTVYRALRHVNPSPYMYFIRMGGVSVVGSSPEMLVRVEGSRVETHPIAGTRPPRPRRRRGPAAGRGAEAEREGARRARDARRSRTQRRRPRLRVRLGAGPAVHGARALLPRHAPDVDRRGQARRRPRSARRARVVLSGRHGVGRAEGAGDADHPGARAVGPRPLRRRGRLSRLRRQSRFLHRHPHGHHVGGQGLRAGRRRHRHGFESRRPSTRKHGTRRARCCARSSSRRRAC